MTPELKPCPFCGGEAVATNSVVDRKTPYAHCKDHRCPGWSVSRTSPAAWNNRAGAEYIREDTMQDISDLAQLQEAQEVTALLKDLFTLLDTYEETDSGQAFRVVQIVCCREDVRAVLNKLLADIKERINYGTMLQG